MFIVTEAAGGYLTAALDNANAAEETAIRLVLEGNTLTPQSSFLPREGGKRG